MGSKYRALFLNPIDPNKKAAGIMGAQAKKTKRDLEAMEASEAGYGTIFKYLKQDSNTS